MKETRRYIASPLPGGAPASRPGKGERTVLSAEQVVAAHVPLAVPHGSVPPGSVARGQVDWDGPSAPPEPGSRPEPAGPEPMARGGRGRGAAEPLGPGGCILLTRDDALADEAALIAAAAGAVLHVCRDMPLPAPDAAPVLLLGPDAALEEFPLGLYGPVILIGYSDSAAHLWKAAARRPGARVAVLPAAAAWLGEFLGEQTLRAGSGQVLLFSGAAGGAGTTTLAALTAAASALRGSRTLLVDADPFSTGLWPILKASPPAGVGWEDLVRSRGRVAPAHLAEILPLAQGTAVLTWSERGGSENAPLSVLGEVVAAARRVYDTVVVDAGRSAGAHEALGGLSDAGIVVVPAAIAPAALRCLSLPSSRIPWHVAVTGRLPAGTDGPRIASAAGLPLLACFPHLRSVAAAAAEGRVAAVLGRRGIMRLLAPFADAIGMPPVAGASLAGAA